MNFENDIILENERVLLRPLQSTDFELLSQSSQSPEAFQWLLSQIHTPELLEKYIQNALAERTQHTRYAFAIFDKKMEKWAGCSSYMNISVAHKRLEIGSSWLGQSFQGTGLNKNFKFLLLQYAFESLDFERVEFKGDKNNLQSRKALEKIGGHFEGILRSHTVRPDGSRRDTFYYSILKSDWQELKSRFFQ